MFLRLILFVPLLRAFLLCEELDLYAAPSTQQTRLTEVRAQALQTAGHMKHDHPVANRTKYKKEQLGVRKRNRLHLLPRLWHNYKVYAYYLYLYHPLWLGEDGVIYREYADLLGNSYFMVAEIEQRDEEGLERILTALTEIDPCKN